MKRLQNWDITLSARLVLARTDPRWPFAARIAHLGDGTLVFGGLTVVYLWGRLSNSMSLRLTVVVSLVALLITATLIFIIKYTLRRERPHDPIGFVTISYDKYSFPSGHSARMSCLAVTILFFSIPLGSIFLLLAPMVALARVLVGVHYISDVVMGLMIGAIIATAVVKVFNIIL